MNLNIYMPLNIVITSIDTFFWYFQVYNVSQYLAHRDVFENSSTNVLYVLKPLLKVVLVSKQWS